MREKKIHTKYRFEGLKERENFEDLGIDGA
jgi:hypothetical protein